MQFVSLDVRLCFRLDNVRVKCVYTQLTIYDILYDLRETGVFFILELL